MYNPTRRNRNIGTKKQGRSKNNHMRIANTHHDDKEFYERFSAYETTSRIINDHEFIFIIEETREGIQHACTVDDIAHILLHIPPEDYGELRYIVLRQPKRKEEIISPVWGRLIYSFEFQDEYYPAIILEAFDSNRKIVRSKKMQLEDAKEIARLRDDGHVLQDTKRDWVIEHDLNHVRSTQLYRTLPHEFGHYVHYLEVVERPAKPDESYDDWCARDDVYCSLSTDEKEKYAHRYADEFKEKLVEQGVIPFARKA